MHKNKRNQKGFTLIELSIVLVIIGLIVGGVLVGQDLIKAAELRAAVGQLEKFDVAGNTFRTKYNGIPGDLLNATSFGFSATGYTAGLTGNGVLDADTTGATHFNEEMTAFFSHLSVANMIQESITGTDFALANVDTISSYVPTSKVGKGAYVLAMSSSGVNYYMVDNATVSNGILTVVHTAITPLDAYGIDSKMDDGSPLTGKILPVRTDIATADTGAASASGVCVDTGLTPDGYNTSNTTYAKVGSCTLRVRASW